MTHSAEHASSRTVRWLLFVVVVCVVASVCCFVALRRYRLPAPTGLYAVGTRILNLTDTSRPDPDFRNASARRELVVQLWYPAAPSQAPIADYQRWAETTLLTRYGVMLPTNSRWNAPVAASAKPFNVLLYSHRWNGERTQNTDLAEELASRGYVVAAIDHPHQASRVELADGRVIKGSPSMEGPGGPGSTAAEQISFWNQQLDVWAADSRFVLDRLAAKNADTTDPLHGHLDTDHAGAFGHSFGGSAALRLCGLEPRIKAAVNLDGWTFGGLNTRTSAEPVMILYEDAYTSRREQLLHSSQAASVEDEMDRNDNATVDANLARYGGYRLVVAGAQHMDFSDQPLLPPLRRSAFTGPIAPLRMQTIVRQTVLQFFNQALHGESSSILTSQQQEFKDVTVTSLPTRQNSISK